MLLTMKTEVLWKNSNKIWPSYCTLDMHQQSKYEVFFAVTLTISAMKDDFFFPSSDTSYVQFQSKLSWTLSLPC